MEGKVIQTALCAVVNINLCLVEWGVAMAIVTVLSPGNIKTTFRLCFFFFFFGHRWYRKALNLHRDDRNALKNQTATITIETFPSPSWQILWDTGVLGGAPVVYCFPAVVSETPSLTLASPLFLCSCDLLFAAPQSG